MIRVLEKTDLIQYALAGNLDVIAHNCNCFCVQGGGIAASMQKTFQTLSFPMESKEHEGEYNKLGTIDCAFVKNLFVVNMYGQYDLGRPSPYSTIPLDYSALRMCLQKLAFTFKTYRIGLPYNIGCGLAGGDWGIVEKMINEIFIENDLTICKL